MGQGHPRAEAVGRQIGPSEAHCPLAGPQRSFPLFYISSTPAVAAIDSCERRPCRRIRSQRILRDFREVWLSDYSHRARFRIYSPSPSLPISHRIASNGSSLAIALATRCRFAGDADDFRCRLGPGASAFFAHRRSALDSRSQLSTAVCGDRARRQIRSGPARGPCRRSASSGVADKDHDALPAVRADRGWHAQARHPAADLDAGRDSRTPPNWGSRPIRPSRSRTRSRVSSPSRRTTPRSSSPKPSAAPKKSSPSS